MPKPNVPRAIHPTPTNGYVRSALLPAFVALLALVLAACGDPPSERTSASTAPPWTAAEVDAVFDLGELGTDLGIDEATGALLLAGRPLPAELVLERPHLTMGRDRNLLGLSDTALAALHPDAARRLRLADAGELRGLLDAYGVDVRDAVAARRDDGVVDVAELVDLAADLDRRAGLAPANTANGPGARLLADLGLSDGSR